MDAKEFAHKHCQACEGGVAALDAAAATEQVQALLPNWTLAADGKSISRDFHFKGFEAAMGFVNAVAWIAQRENHHPDLEVGYSHCLVRYSTHAVAGLSENDLICAAKVEALLD